MRVYVTRRIPEAGLELLRNNDCNVTVNPHDRPLTRQELLQLLPETEALLSMLNEKLDAEALARAKHLKVIANYGVGYNNIDVDEATRRGIVVTNTPDVLTDATADVAWTLLMMAARRAGEAERFARTGQWDGWGPMQFLGHDIQGRTLGVIGAGRIGTAVALRARGFDMPVLYTHPRPAPELDERLGAQRVELDTLLQQSDFVSLNVYLNDETRHMIGREQLQRMKNTAVLVNTARGAVIDEAALVDALTFREIAAAGLDVYEEEPKIHPGLYELDNVVLLPHIGSATVETRTEMSQLTARNILAVKNGETPLTQVKEQTGG